MRYKLIPTRAWRGPIGEGDWVKPEYVYADGDDEALYLAQRRRESILICRAPEGGTVRPLEIIGDEPQKAKGRKR